MSRKSADFEIKDEYRRFWYDKEVGAIRIELFVENYIHTLKHAKEEFDFFYKVMKHTGDKVSIISWPKGFKGHDEESEKFIVSDITAQRVGYIVSVLESQVKRKILQFLISVKKTPFKLEFAKCEIDAFELLQEAKKNYAVDKNLVLVVDDNRDHREIHAKQVEKIGYKIIQSESAKATNNLLKTLETGQRPYFIICDYNMEERGSFKKVAGSVCRHSPYSRLICATNESPKYIDAQQAEIVVQKPTRIDKVLTSLI